jgi:hypothetical protein
LPGLQLTDVTSYVDSVMSSAIRVSSANKKPHSFGMGNFHPALTVGPHSGVLSGQVPGHLVAPKPVHPLRFAATQRAEQGAYARP